MPEVNVKYVSEMTGYSEGYIRWLVSRRLIPHKKIGGRLLFDTNKIRSWVESRTEEREVEQPQ